MVTALFVDVVGSTMLGERFDPEDFRDIVSEAVSRALRVCERYGGVIENVAGDGALALFGATVAHEDDPERAVLAGLDIVGEVADWAGQARERWGVESLAVRVGIETGTAVVGVQGGSIESGSMGDTLNTAARIQSLAQPGTVLVGSRTRRLVEGLFEWGDAREADLRGKSRPVVVAEALARRADPIPGRAHAEAAFVGREDELARAEVAIRAVLSGSGQVVVLSGEAGAGKTRLLAEMRELFERASAEAGRPGVWLVGRCASYGGTLPYWPIQGILRSWLGAPASGALDETALRDRLEPVVAGAEGRVLGPLASMLGVARRGAHPGREPAAPEDARQRLHEAFLLLAERLATQAPLALAVEDIHWADASSADLLEQLAGVAGRFPLLLVATGRPEGAALDSLACVAEEADGGHLTEIPLGPLPPDAERALLAGLIGEAAIPADAERTIIEQAEGNPLYLEELARALLEAGSDAQPGAAVELPDTLEKIVLARVDRLPDHCHAVLGAAAVLGRSFDRVLLELVAGQDAGAALAELERVDLVRPEGAGYRFKHFVIREAAYNALLRSERRTLHGRAAEALEEAGDAEGGHDLGLIAVHHRAAGDLDRALDFRARAADAAAAIPAFPEALAHADDGLAVATDLGRDGDDPRVRRLLFRRAEASFAMGRIDEARRDLGRHHTAARSAGNVKEQMESLHALAAIARFDGDWDAAERHAAGALEMAEGLGDTATQTSILRQLSILASNRLRLDRALHFGERARRLAEASERGGDMAAALDALKLAALYVGDLDMLERTAGPLIDFHREQDDFSMPRYWALYERAHVALVQGRFEEASGQLDQAWEDSRHAGRQLFAPILLATRCWLERSRGNFADAIAHGREGAELAASMETDEWEAWARAALGWAFLDAGRPRPAAVQLRTGLRAAEKSAALAQHIRCAALLADAARALGDLDEAAELAGRAEDLLAEVSTPPGRAWLWGGHAIVAVGRVRLALGDAGRACAHTEQLAEIAAGAGWQELAADARVVLGQAALAEDREAEAREALEHALAGAAPYPAVAARAREALAALNGVAGP